MTDNTLYFRNPGGATVAMTERFYNDYYSTVVAGNRYPLPGWIALTEDEARANRPQMFGAPDPDVEYTIEELKRRRDVLAFKAEVRAEAEAVAKGKKA